MAMSALQSDTSQVWLEPPLYVDMENPRLYVDLGVGVTTALAPPVVPPPVVPPPDTTQPSWVWYMDNLAWSPYDPSGS